MSGKTKKTIRPEDINAMEPEEKMKYEIAGGAGTFG